jgi:hypothetical protein
MNKIQDFSDSECLSPTTATTVFTQELEAHSDFSIISVEDTGNHIYWVSFIYGLSIIAPWNAILSTLDFFAASTPDYPITFVVSFAVNGVMVLIVLLCIAYSDRGSHILKINITFFVTAVLLVLLPVTVDLSMQYNQSVCFWVTCVYMVLLGSLTAVS